MQKEDLKGNISARNISLVTQLNSATYIDKSVYRDLRFRKEHICNEKAMG
jgi:hypothetical protein